MIEFFQISKTFSDDTAALKDVSFKIKKGEFVVILGPSGSGKTTLLRTINGLIHPTSGTVSVMEADVNPKTLSRIRKKTGMIFQQFNLVKNLSVINNVLSGSLGSFQNWKSGFYISPKTIRLKALEVIDRVGLLDKAYHRADRLSGGQQQRVGIARALMQEPDILLADEPIASLDPMISFNILSLLRKICLEDNITVLCSLHQVDFALRFAQRIVGLAEGKIVMDEEAKNLTTEYIKKIYASHEQGMFFGTDKDTYHDDKLIAWSKYE